MALNRTGDLAEIDEVKLGELLESIRDDGMDELLESMAYTEKEAVALIATASAANSAVPVILGDQEESSNVHDYHTRANSNTVKPV